MRASGLPIPNEDDEPREVHGEAIGEDIWSSRFGLLIVVLSSLVLWSGMVLLVAWIF